MRLADIDSASQALYALRRVLGPGNGEVHALGEVLLAELSGAMGTLSQVDNVVAMAKNGDAPGGVFKESDQEPPSYADFADLFEHHGVKPVDGMGKWFREFGGWDKASDDILIDTFRRIGEYYTANPHQRTQPEGRPWKPQSGNTAVAVNMLECPVCGKEAKMVPAGFSQKTGKKYNEFWGCRDRQCNATWRSEDEWRSKRR